MSCAISHRCCHFQLLTCAVNSACLALLNSGVGMRHVVAAVGCAVDEVGNLLLEPSYNEVQNAKAMLYFVFDSREKKLVTGKWKQRGSKKNTFRDADIL